MRKTVLKRIGRRITGYPGRWRMTRIHGARRAQIPGMPWFRCFTNRWWSPPTGVRYIVSEAATGFTPDGTGDGTRQHAIQYATYRLQRLSRPRVLAAIARVHAGHTDRQRIPQRFRARAL